MTSMLTVDAVVKRYGRRTALHELSFTAQRGEIIALLGRNGAGKSTLMNILTGYIAMTSGRASVAGYDVQAQALHARQHVGYLPEQPPLYPEATVTEYLRYCAGLKGIPRRETAARIGETVALTGLENERRRLCGQLSKGYRQRLGLAQAMLGRPDLLILDEPGSGLDPLQMSQMREVIRGAAAHSTVLLSSHILSEVTDICTRAIVLDQGHCLYDGDMQSLLTSRHAQRIVWRGGEGVGGALASLPGVTVEGETESPDGARSAILRMADDASLAAVAPAVLACGADLLTLAPQSATLESAFLHLIGKEATDE